MMRPIESSNLRVDGIVETCINVAEINRAREFYQLLFNFEAMVSDERFCALRAGPDVLLLFTQGGSNDPVVIRGGIIPPHETRGPGHLAFAISSDALETWRTRLRECGIEIESEVQWERGGASLYFRDPDANLLELATQASGRIIEPANLPALRRSDTPPLLPMLNALSPRNGNLHLFSPPSSCEPPHISGRR
jgi:catechol 2,3-dioxygenase-like lactoylglutathione lyase family enzyme